MRWVVGQVGRVVGLVMGQVDMWCINNENVNFLTFIMHGAFERELCDVS